MFFFLSLIQDSFSSPGIYLEQYQAIQVLGPYMDPEKKKAFIILSFLLLLLQLSLAKAGTTMAEKISLPTLDLPPSYRGNVRSRNLNA